MQFTKKILTACVVIGLSTSAFAMENAAEASKEAKEKCWAVKEGEASHGIENGKPYVLVTKEECAARQAATTEAKDVKAAH